MGPFEAITAIFTFADSLAKIRLAEMEALRGTAQLTAEVSAIVAQRQQMMADALTFGQKVYNDAMKLGMFVGSIGGKLKDAVTPDAKPA